MSDKLIAAKNTKPLFVVGVPTNGEHSHFFTQFMMGTEWPVNFSMNYRGVEGMEVGRARNILAQEAVDLGAKYLMFIDEDTIGPANGVRKLMYNMEQHPDWTVCGGVYVTKTFPPEPLIFTEWGAGPSWDWKRGEMVKIKASGLGFHLIRVADLAKMAEKIETYIERDPWRNVMKPVHEWFKTGKEFASGKDGTELAMHTEDTWFYRQAELDGYHCFIDTAVECMHYDKHSKQFFTVPFDDGVCKRPDAWERSPRVCNLGAGGAVSPYEVNVDLREGPYIFRCDVRSLPGDWSMAFDAVKSHHVLEHFSFTDSEAILREWVRIIKPGGTLELVVPNIAWAAQTISEDPEHDISTYLQGVIYGDQGNPLWLQGPYGGTHGDRYLPWSYENNTHKAGFTPKSLGRIMQAVGLEDIHGHAEQFQFVIYGRKPDPGAPVVPPPPATTPEGIAAADPNTV